MLLKRNGRMYHVRLCALSGCSQYCSRLYVQSEYFRGSGRVERFAPSSSPKVLPQEGILMYFPDLDFELEQKGVFVFPCKR
jgi:hypothetical protein